MNPIELFQLDLGGRIKSAAYFNNKPCFVYRPRAKESLAAVDTRINNALNARLKQGGASGVAISVFMPITDIPDQDPYNPIFETTGTIRIAENVLLNMSPAGTLCTAEDIGLQLVLLIRNFTAQRIYSAVTCAKEALTPVGTLEDDDNVLLYDLKFVTRFTISATQKTVWPAISGNAGAVTLTNQDKDATAQIYYTTDLSYPRPSLAEEAAMAQNPNTSTLYAGPFVVQSGTVVRAAAYSNGKQPSDVALCTLT